MLRDNPKFAIQAIMAGAVFVSISVQAAPIALPWGIDLTPSLDSQISYDDNVTSSATDDIESWLRVISSTMEFAVDNGVDFYSLVYTAETANYLSSRQDDYVDQILTAAASIELSRATSLAIDGSIQAGHEDRGTGFTMGNAGQLDGPDEFLDRQVGVTLDYRPESNPFVAGLLLATQDREYEEFLAQPGRDRKNDTAGMNAGFRIGARTTVLTEIVYSEFDFVFDPGATGDSFRGLDNQQIDYLVGIDWSSAKTDVNLRFGERHKGFSETGPEDFVGPTWQLRMAWSPVTYSTFSFVSSRQTTEPRALADFVDTKSNSLTWNHNWSSQFSSAISYGQQVDDYYGIDQVDRRQSSSLSLNYSARGWLTFQAGINHVDQDSSLERLRFQRNISFIGFSVSL